MKIVITTASFAEFDARPLQFLKNAGYDVVLNPYGRTLTSAEVNALAADAVGIVAGTEPLDRSVLEKLSSLRFICRCGAGMDNVDLAAAGELNIKVDNTPSGPTLAVAELTVGLILDLLRKSTRMDREMRACIWKKRMGNLLSGKKVGIIGFGRIGQKTAELLTAFGCELSYYDSADIQGCKDLRIKKLELSELLRSCDILTIHVSGKYEKPLLGPREFEMMKEGAWIVNVARGGAVDEEALCSALREGRVAGAALDVYEKEPYDGSLREVENVILTPHIGSYAREARIEMEIEAAQKLVEGLEETGHHND
jgi:D-3-phosphoglycerate dehydrogenase / 2-oxoglutarate reductase